MALFGFGKPNVEKMKGARDLKGLAKTLEYEDYQLRKQAAEALLSFGASSIPVLLPALENKNGNARIHASWALALMVKTPEALEPQLKNQLNLAMMKSQQDAIKVVRQNAVFTLGRIGDDRAIPLLVERLKDYDAPDVMDNAVTALGKLCASSRDTLLQASAIAHLISHLKVVKDAARANTLSVLAGLTKNKEALDPRLKFDIQAALLSSLADPFESVRLCAVRSLDPLYNPTVLAGLVSALYDKEAKVRQAALEALLPVKEQAIGHLTERMLTDPQALNALEQFGWTPRDDYTRVRYWISLKKPEKCVELGDRAISPLGGCLSCGEPARRLALEALAKVYEQTADPSVHRQIAEKVCPHLEARDFEARSLGKVLDDPAVASGIATRMLKVLGKPDAANAHRSSGRMEDRVLDAISLIGLVGQRIAEPGIKARVVETLVSCLVAGVPEPDRATPAGARKALGNRRCAAAVRALGSVGLEGVSDGWISDLVIDALIQDLSNPIYALRRPAAEALVKAYRQGGLSERGKQAILAQRGKITEPYENYHDETGAGRSSDCASAHVDKGIGVDFPL